MIKLRKVEYYTGYEITKEVIKKINIIALRRYCDSCYSLSYKKYHNLKGLCESNDCSKPEYINVVLGEDWYIIYSKTKNYIEINEWVDVENVPNKLEQTMEMYSALKKILLLSEDKTLLATMKHNTSYKFYSSLIQRGLLQEFSDDVFVEEELPKDVEITKNQIEEQYGFVEDFLKDPNRNQEQEEALEDYIYHDVIFDITDGFKTRYKK